MPGRLLTFLMSVLVPSFCLGSVVSFSGPPVEGLSVADTGVSVQPVALVQIPGVTPEGGLKAFLTGAGIRKKRILFFGASVYVAASYVEGEQKLSSKEPMADLTKRRVRVMQLTMLRDLGANQIRSAFSDSLSANGVNLNEPAVREVLQMIKFDLKEKTTGTFVGYVRGPNAQGIIYELSDKSLRAEGEKLADQFWSIWFGNPADSGLADLKLDLVGLQGP